MSQHYSDPKRASKEEWDALQTAYRDARAAEHALDLHCRVAYGPDWKHYGPRKMITKYQQLQRATCRAYDRCMTWLEKHCTWEFKSGTSASWLCDVLRYEDAVGVPGTFWLPSESAGYGAPQKARLTVARGQA